MNKNMNTIVVKLGSKLVSTSETGANTQFLEQIAIQVKWMSENGFAAVVVSSGAVAFGRYSLRDYELGKKRITKKDLIQRQALASIGQPYLISSFRPVFAKYNLPVAQILLTREVFKSRTGYLNTRNTISRLLEIGVVPIINENDVVSTNELSDKIYGDNDRLSAIVANVLDAKKLILLGTTDGMYTADPVINSSATKINIVDSITDKIKKMAKGPNDKFGSGGMISKLKGAEIATESGIEVVIASGLNDSVIKSILQNKNVGTRILAKNRTFDAKSRWIITGISEERGNIIIDAGAVEALQNRPSSLLPAGIDSVKGIFEQGELISISTPTKEVIGFGITNYSSGEIQLIKKVHSDQISKLTKHFRGEVVIHRNNMVLI